MAIDWDDLRLAAAMRAEGSAAGAARRLGIDQTTAARRLARLERAAGLALFDRVDRRLTARPVLEAIGEDLAILAATVARIEARIADERSALSGTVVVSTVDLVAARLLAPALARLRASHPGIRLVVDVVDANVSLAAREADVALRLARPAEDEALVRRVGSLAFGLYGPAGRDDADTLPLAAWTEALAHVGESRWLAAVLPEVPVALRCDRASVLIEAVAAGHRAVLPRLAAEGDARLVRLREPAPIPPRELWLMVHPQRRRDRAVAAVVAWIEATLAEPTGAAAP